MFIRHVLRHVEEVEVSRLGRGRNVNTSGNCVGTCVEEIKRIARNPGGISMQGHCRESLHFLLSLSLEGVSQMAYILPERLLALVCPAFDLVLRRIRSLKRCVQA